MKKNNTAEKTVQEAKALTEALKESTKKSFKEIMKEALDNIITDEDDEEEVEAPVDDTEDELGDSYGVEDVETDEVPEVSDEEEPAEGEGEEAPAEGEADDEWSDMEEYKVGDNDYDFTGLDGEDKDDIVLKVFNKLGDDDQIFVKKDEDGNYEVKDEETGAEYVIELDADAEEAKPEEGEEDGDIEIELDDEENGEGEDDDIDISLEDGDEEEEKIDEEKQEFTDSYQKKDAIEGLNVNEPADKSATYSMDAGAPEGTERPYGKPGEGEPFEQKVNEGKTCPKCGKEVCECGKVDECGNMTEEPIIDEDGSGLNTKHSTKKNTNHINRSAQNQRHVSTDGDYQALKESAMKIYNKAKLIQEENKRYKGYIEEIKKSLTEAAVLNVSLTQALKLVVENTTTANEKKSILKRFNEVKTLKESKALYETIKNELNESKKSEPLLERTISAAPSKTLNETTIYDKNNNPSLNLMERMDNLWK